MRWQVGSVRWRALAAIAAAASAFAACSPADVTTPVIEGSGGLRIVSGSGQADTVFATVGAPLVVELRDSVSGRPIANATVVFDGTNGFSFGRRVPYVTPFRPGVEASRQFTETAVTDASGRAAVRIALGNTVGTSEVVVTCRAVPAARVTAQFTIVGGRPAGVLATPADTAIYIGKSYQLAAVAADQARNPTAGPLRYEALTPLVATISASGVVTARRVGRASFRLATSVGDTTVFMTVPPSGVLYSVEADTARFFGYERGPYHVFRSNLDGSDRSEVFAPAGLNQGGFAMAPSGGATVWTFGTGQLSALRQDGATAPAPFPVSGVLSVANPKYSRQGDFLYFSARTAGTNYELWRARPDGSEPVRVGPAADTPTARDLGAAVSPDGRYVAYWTNRDTQLGAMVQVLDLSTGAATGPGTPGHSPRWRPDGQGLVIIAPSVYSVPYDSTKGRLATVTFDGTSPRVYDFVRTEPFDVAYRAGFSLSPDGTYALARSTLGTMEVVNLTTFERLPLPFTRRAIAAEWR